MKHTITDYLDLCKGIESIQSRLEVLERTPASVTHQHSDANERMDKLEGKVSDIDNQVKVWQVAHGSGTAFNPIRADKDAPEDAEDRLSVLEAKVAVLQVVGALDGPNPHEHTGVMERIKAIEEHGRIHVHSETASRITKLEVWKEESSDQHDGLQALRKKVSGLYRSCQALEERFFVNHNELEGQGVRVGALEARPKCECKKLYSLIEDTHGCIEVIRERLQALEARPQSETAHVHDDGVKELEPRLKTLEAKVAVVQIEGRLDGPNPHVHTGMMERLDKLERITQWSPMGEDRIKAIERRLNNIEAGTEREAAHVQHDGLQALEKRVEDLEKETTPCVRHRLGLLEEGVQNFMERLQTHEHVQLNERIEQVDRELDRQVEGFDKRVKALEVGERFLHEFQKQLGNVQARVDELQTLFRDVGRAIANVDPTRG